MIVSKFSQNIKVDKTKIKKDILKNNKQKNYLLSEIVFNWKTNFYCRSIVKLKKKFTKMGSEMLHQRLVFQIVPKQVENLDG